MKLTMISLIPFCLGFQALFTKPIQGKKRFKEDDSGSSKEEENRAIDRLAVNLAGAFVKSIFPEIDRSSHQQANNKRPDSDPNSSEVRRAPIPLNLQLMQQGTGARFAHLQQQGQVANLLSRSSLTDFPVFAGLGQQSESNINTLSGLLPTSQIASLIPSLSDNTDSAATVEAINAAKRQKYLIDLQRHQNELNQYSGRQLEYLDQQRRYQEAMVNHQAGAALLIQQQQQDFLNKMKKKYGGFVDHSTKGHKTKDSETLDHVKQFLSRRELDDKMKEGILNSLQYLDKEKPRKAQPKENQLEEELEQLSEIGECHKCLPVNVNKLKGSWTQVYGNPGVLSKTYSTVLSILEFNKQSEISGDRDEPLTVNITSKRASCVGLEIGEKNGKHIGVNLYFRDDTISHELYEMNGIGRVVGSTLKLDLDIMQTSVCLVKAGPADVNAYEYIILTDTSAPSTDERCTSYQVFSRETDEFHLRHYDDVADFLKTQVMNDRRILSVAPLPLPKLCQLNNI